MHSPSLQAPFQKSRRIHCPAEPVDGTYTYRVTKQPMPADDELQAGTQLQLDIEEKAVTYDGLVDIGFTRNFASSQAYREQFGNHPDIIARRRQGWAGLREGDVEDQTRRKPDTQAFRDRVVFST